MREPWALVRLFDRYLSPGRIGVYGGVRDAVTAFETEEDEQTVNAAREQAEWLRRMVTDHEDSLDLVELLMELEDQAGLRSDQALPGSRPFGGLLDEVRRCSRSRTTARAAPACANPAGRGRNLRWPTRSERAAGSERRRGGARRPGLRNGSSGGGAPACGGDGRAAILRPWTGPHP